MEARVRETHLFVRAHLLLVLLVVPSALHEHLLQPAGWCVRGRWACSSSRDWRGGTLLRAEEDERSQDERKLMRSDHAAGGSKEAPLQQEVRLLMQVVYENARGIERKGAKRERERERERLCEMKTTRKTSRSVAVFASNRRGAVHTHGCSCVYGCSCVCARERAGSREKACVRERRGRRRRTEKSKPDLKSDRRHGQWCGATLTARAICAHCEAEEACARGRGRARKQRESEERAKGRTSRGCRRSRKPAAALSAACSPAPWRTARCTSSTQREKKREPSLALRK